MPCEYFFLAEWFCFVFFLLGGLFLSFSFIVVLFWFFFFPFHICMLQLLCCFFLYCSCLSVLYSICSDNAWVISYLFPQYPRMFFFHIPSKLEVLYVLILFYCTQKGGWRGEKCGGSVRWPEVLKFYYISYTKNSLQLIRTQYHSHWRVLLHFKLFSVSFLLFSLFPLFHSPLVRRGIREQNQLNFLSSIFGSFCKNSQIFVNLPSWFLESCGLDSEPSYVLYHCFIPKSAVSCCNRLCLFPYLVVWWIFLFVDFLHFS